MGLEREISIKFLLKQITVWVLIVAFNFSIAGKIITIFNFYKNQNFIENNLCVQKNKKNNCCKGQCHLTKELSKLDDFQTRPFQNEKPNRTTGILKNDWIFEELEESYLNYWNENSTVRPIDRPLIIESIYLVSIDHPPQFVC